jgi:rfaE bifunctional protein nucleotidyltransferase chain/domain
MQHPESKILTWNEAVEWSKKLKSEGKKIVFTNGCFDIIHKGHLDYLFKAAQQGDKLIVAVNSDESVKNLQKSPARPLQDENGRALALASLYFVDVVVIFNEPTPYEIIKALIPNILVKGADYKPESIVGYDIVIQNGGSVSTIPFIDGYSTSAIEQKILRTHGK